MRRTMCQCQMSWGILFLLWITRNFIPRMMTDTWCEWFSGFSLILLLMFKWTCDQSIGLWGLTHCSPEGRLSWLWALRFISQVNHFVPWGETWDKAMQLSITERWHWQWKQLDHGSCAPHCYLYLIWWFRMKGFHLLLLDNLFWTGIFDGRIHLVPKFTGLHLTHL